MKTAREAFEEQKRAAAERKTTAAEQPRRTATKSEHAGPAPVLAMTMQEDREREADLVTEARQVVASEVADLRRKLALALDALG